MNVKYITGDICTFQGDAIVNAANVTLLGGGGVDGAIHRAAGPQLREWCHRFPERWPQHQDKRIKTGEAVATPGFKLPCQMIIHTVGPIYPKGRDLAFPGEEKIYDLNKANRLLTTAIRACLLKAEEHNVRTLAFPALSCGVFGCDIGVFAERLHMCLLGGNEGQVWKMDTITVYLFDEIQYGLFDLAWQRLTNKG